jgi:Tfp pilus assembly protein PilN
MIRVNLLSTGPSGKGPVVLSPHLATVAGVVMLLLTVTGVGLWWWQLGREAAALDVRITKSESDLARLKQVAKLVDRAIARKSELSEKLALIERLRASQHGPVNLLATVSRSMTDGLWLMELNQRGAVVQLEGRATSLTAVTDFVERLQSSGIFDRPVEIVTTSMEPVDDTAVVRFAVKAQAAGTNAAAAAAAAAAAHTVRKGD